MVDFPKSLTQPKDSKFIYTMHFVFTKPLRLFCIFPLFSFLMLSSCCESRFWTQNREPIHFSNDDFLLDPSRVLFPKPELQFEHMQITKKRLDSVPARFRTDPELAGLIVKNFMASPQLWETGVYSTVGHAKVFVALKSKIPSYSQLYWAMMQVLSKEYSCFMTAKMTHKEMTGFVCRDGRRVLFSRLEGPNWLGFYGRQYDKSGKEIYIKHHLIHYVEEEKANKNFATLSF